MIVLQNLAILGVGFVVLVVAGDLLVRGSTAVARRAGVPPLLVGLTIVAFGTSAPELFVGVQAVWSGAPTLAIGNVVGSNIANVFLVLGLPALIAPIVSNAPGVIRNAWTGVAAAALLVLFCTVLADRSTGVAALDWRHGLALLALIVTFIGLQGWRARRHMRAEDAAEPEDPELQELLHIDDMDGLPQRWPWIWGFVAVGVIGLPFGGWLIVESGTQLADALGVPNAFVGLTLVALGTSLPELAATTAAALRRHTELAIGNVLGSNIFNIFAVAGAAALAGRVPVPEVFPTFDLPIMAISAGMLLAVAYARQPIGWRVGLIFLAAYATYILFLARAQGLM